MKTSCKNSKGFTLIEIVATLAVIGVILYFGMTIDLGVFRRDVFLSEELKIISILERARSRAMNNMHDADHGVCFDSPNYIIFRGSVCTAGETITANTNITVTFPSSPIIFERLTGNTDGHSISITDGLKSAKILINNEGAIIW